MITTGVAGRPWRATVTPWGAVQPWDGSAPLDWYVAADDRWHVPAREPATRQRRLDGTAVVETRVRVPGGDAVHRVYSVADGAGMTVVEVENDSPMPIAVAFDRRDVLTERPVADVPIEGIELPAGSFVLPVGHRATARVALAHGTARGGRLPASLPAAAQVARGWLAVTERASRLVLPDGDLGAALVERVTAVRCEAALGALPDAAADPAGWVLALGERTRMGEPPGEDVVDLAGAVAAIGPRAGWDGDAALAAARRVLDAAGETRARRDLDRIVARRPLSPPPPAPPGGVRDVAWLEQRLAHDGALLPAGFPAAWLGAPFEVHGVPVGPTTTVSYAVRWHGARPAVLWEVTGGPVTLTAPAIDPGWRTTESSGEALWPAPTRDPAPDVSFG